MTSGSRSECGPNYPVKVSPHDVGAEFLKELIPTIAPQWSIMNVVGGMVDHLFLGASVRPFLQEF